MSTLIRGKYYDLKLIKEALELGLQEMEDPFSCAPTCRLGDEIQEFYECSDCRKNFIENIIWEEI